LGIGSAATNGSSKLYTEEDGYLRGARIADKIQEFYNGSKTNGFQMARGELQSQGGVRSLHNKQPQQILLADQNEKRAASAYGSAQGGG